MNAKIALTVLAAASTALLNNIVKDRDWLWLKGDYREKPEIRDAIKRAGFRYARRGHKVGDEVAHWYWCGRPRKDAGDRSSNQTSIANKPAPVVDPEAEFRALFG